MRREIHCFETKSGRLKKTYWAKCGVGRGTLATLGSLR